VNKSERNRLVVDNLPLVGYLVSDLASRATHLSRDDLASAGSLGLIAAADAYDPELGVPFGAYARRRITGAIADELRQVDWASRTIRKRIKETLAVQESLMAALGRQPEIDEIASALGVDRATAAEAVQDAGRSVSSLDESIGDSLAAEIAGPEDAMLTAERESFVRAAVGALPERMRYVVEQVYFGERSVTELAEELGATHSAVSQQRSEALRLLRDGLQTHYADPGQGDEVHSRISAPRRAAYLGRLGEYAGTQLTRLGMTPPIAPQAPGLPAAG